MKGIPGERACFRLVPPNRTWLPEAVAEAARERRLVRAAAASASASARAPRSAGTLRGLRGRLIGARGMLGKLPLLEPEALYLVASVIAPSDRHVWIDSGAGLVIGTAEASVDQALREEVSATEERAATRLAASRRDDVDHNLMASDLELAICGLALLESLSRSTPQAHLRPASGRDLGNARRPAMLRVEVRTGEVLVHALRRACRRASERSRPADSVPLGRRARGDARGPVPVPRHRGRLRRRRALLPVARASRCSRVRPWRSAAAGTAGLRLPGAPGREQYPLVRRCEAAKARASGFTLDRVLAGRRQAAMRIGQGSRSAQCPCTTLSDLRAHRQRGAFASRSRCRSATRSLPAPPWSGSSIPSLPDDEEVELLSETMHRARCHRFTLKSAGDSAAPRRTCSSCADLADHILHGHAWEEPSRRLSPASRHGPGPASPVGLAVAA